MESPNDIGRLRHESLWISAPGPRLEVRLCHVNVVIVKLKRRQLTSAGCRRHVDVAVRHPMDAQSASTDAKEVVSKRHTFLILWRDLLECGLWRHRFSRDGGRQ